MSTKTGRKANINMRSTAQEKLFLEKAAERAGFSNLTNFMMTAARKEAFRILNDINTTYISSNDLEVVNKLLSNPPEPNEQLKALLSKKE